MKQSEIVARHISQQIIAEGMAEGTRLPPEKAMIEEYQVGRGTLREALRLLETRGVLSIKTGREGGPVVRRPRPSDLAETISLILRFDGIPVSQVLAAQRALAPRLARQAAAQASAQTLTAMGECLDRMDRYVDQPAVFDAETRRFHALLGEAAGSPVLAMLVGAVETVVDGLREDESGQDVRTSSRARRVALTSLHQRLYEALGRRDGDAAGSAIADLLDTWSPVPTNRPRRRRGVRGAPPQIDLV